MQPGQLLCNITALKDVKFSIRKRRKPPGLGRLGGYFVEDLLSATD